MKYGGKSRSIKPLTIGFSFSYDEKEREIKILSAWLKMKVKINIPIDSLNPTTLWELESAAREKLGWRL